MTTPRKILYMPGWASGRLGQTSLLEALRMRFRVHVLWLPDIGCADWEPCQPFSRIYLSGLLDLVRQEKEPVAIAGWSMGGMAAMELSASLPDKVTHLALISTTARFCSDGNSPGAAVSDVKQMLTGLTSSPETVLRQFFMLAGRPERMASEFVEQKVNDAIQASPAQLVLGLNYLLEADLRPILNKINAPTIILHGDKDQIVPVQAAQRLRDGIRGSELLILPEKGHLLPDQCPDLIAEHILTFLSCG